MREPLAAGRGHRHVLRPHRARATDHPHGRQEPDRGRAPGRRRAAPPARQPARRPASWPAIPLSMLVAFTAMRQLGLSGNLMSLGAIDFGLIVDGSVVMIENIVRVLARARATSSDGTPTATSDPSTARHRSRGRSSSAVGIIMIVYLPILALRGIEGKMFRPMALTVMFALAASLVLRAHAHAGAGEPVPQAASRRQEPWLFRQAQRIYAPLLDRACHAGARHRRRSPSPSSSRASAWSRSSAPSSSRGSTRAPSPCRSGASRASRSSSRTRSARRPREGPARAVPRGQDGRVAHRARRDRDRSMGVEITDTFIMLKPPERVALRREALVEAIDAALRARCRARSSATRSRSSCASRS